MRLFEGELWRVRQSLSCKAEDLLKRMWNPFNQSTLKLMAWPLTWKVVWLGVSIMWLGRMSCGLRYYVLVWWHFKEYCKSTCNLSTFLHWLKIWKWAARKIHRCTSLIKSRLYHRLVIDHIMTTMCLVSWTTLAENTSQYFTAQL